MVLRWFKPLRLFWVLFFPLQAFASAQPVDAQNLKTILPQDCQFSATFAQQKKLAEIPIPLNSSGNFLFSCKQGLIWNQIQPFREALLYTKHHINFDISQDKVKSLKGSLHYSLSKVLIGLMRGDVAYIEKNFSVQPLDDQARAGYLLIPSNTYMKKAIARIALWKTKLTGAVHYQITDVQQQQTLVTIENIQSLDERQYSNVVDACVGLLGFSKNTCDALRYPMRYQ